MGWDGVPEIVSRYARGRDRVLWWYVTGGVFVGLAWRV